MNSNVIDKVDDTRHTLNDEHRKIVKQLNEIMLGKKHVIALCLRK